MKSVLSILVFAALIMAGSAVYAEESGCFQKTDNWIIRVYSEDMAGQYRVMLAVIDPVTALRVPHSSIKAFAGAAPTCKNLDRASSHLCEIESAAQSPDLSLGCDTTAGTAYIIHDQAGYPTITTIPDIIRAAAPNPPALVATPGFLDYGKVLTGRKTLSVTVTNNSATGVHISSVSMPAAPYRKATDSCTGAVLAPSTGSCTISMTFAPVTTGTYSGNFDINSDAGTISVQLTGMK
jgi:hypothetical protein